MKPARRTVGLQNKSFSVFASDGHRIIRRTKRAEGEALANAGVFQRVLNEHTGEVVAYRLPARVDAAGGR